MNDKRGLVNDIVFVQLLNKAIKIVIHFTNDNDGYGIDKLVAITNRDLDRIDIHSFYLQLHSLNKNANTKEEP